MKEYFRINITKYSPDKHFDVVRPASLDNPKDNAVMFISKRFVAEADKLACAFERVKDCLVFWPEGAQIPNDLDRVHAMVICENPHNAFSRFFVENNITYLPRPCKYELINGAFIELGAQIAPNCVVFPGAYIGCEVSIGEGAYIGSGVKLLGSVSIGKNVVIRENTVIGADGLTTDRNECGRALTIPQFGGVSIGDDVQIGANVVIARGAIDDTVICRGVKIGSSVYISHNVYIGADTFIVAKAIMFGSASAGERVMLSGNSLVANRVHIGDDSILGISSAAVKSIPSGKVAYGTPAKVVRDR